MQRGKEVKIEEWKLTKWFLFLIRIFSYRYQKLFKFHIHPRNIHISIPTPNLISLDKISSLLAAVYFDQKRKKGAHLCYLTRFGGWHLSLKSVWVLTRIRFEHLGLTLKGVTRPNNIWVLNQGISFFKFGDFTSQKFSFQVFFKYSSKLRKNLGVTFCA